MNQVSGRMKIKRIAVTGHQQILRVLDCHSDNSINDLPLVKAPPKMENLLFINYILQTEFIVVFISRPLPILILEYFSLFVVGYLFFYGGFFINATASRWWRWFDGGT